MKIQWRKTMLSLSQRPGGRFVIEHGGEILNIHILEKRGQQTRLAFECPDSFRVLRGEVADRIANGPTGCSPEVQG
jgi:sRNA-binding carbon storage regulator CsrA